MAEERASKVVDLVTAQMVECEPEDALPEEAAAVEEQPDADADVEPDTQ